MVRVRRSKRTSSDQRQTLREPGTLMTSGGRTKVLGLSLLCTAAVTCVVLLGSRLLEHFPPGAHGLTVTSGLGLDIGDGAGGTVVSLRRYGGDVDDATDCGTGDSETCWRTSAEEVRIRPTIPGETVTCFEVEHKALVEGVDSVGQCFSLHSSSWYGGAQLLLQPWPLWNMTLPLTPFASCDLFSHRRHVGAVLERYFLSASGVGIHVDDHVPLYVTASQDGDQLMCLVAKLGGFPYPRSQSDRPELKFTLCHGWDMRTVHKFMASQLFPRPNSTPDARMIQSPIWSTWAQYNKNISQSLVLEFARQILENGFPHSQLEIDDDWTPRYGDLDFDREKFPDPAGMVRELKDLGFRVTVWVHPFFNTDSVAWKEAAKNCYVVMKRSHSGKEEPATVKWWDGEGGLLDVTNKDAVDWFLSKLRKLRTSYGIASFKFDAGESFYLPENYVTKNPMTSPDEYATRWAELAHMADPEVKHQEVRVAWKSQHLPIFVRMFDRFSSWRGEAGLQTVIPCVLHFSLIGYPFVLPDMIGGNAYQDLVSFQGGAFPPKELYIRWLEVTALLPAMQFSIAPWHYDTEVVSLCHKYLMLHETYSPLLLQLASNAVHTGDPIIRPLWWTSPTDETAQAISTEFLVGDELLVAPVLEEGARSRDIYLPRGSWFDMLRGETLKGPLWVKDYPAELEDLPYFKRLPTIAEPPEASEEKDEL